VRLLCHGEILIAAVEVADSFSQRSRGLLGRNGLAPGTALWLKPCGCIHTFGMRFPLDLLFLDRQGVVVRWVRAVAPGRMVFGGWRAHSVLEMEAGWLTSERIRPGDRLTEDSAA